MTILSQVYASGGDVIIHTLELKQRRDKKTKARISESLKGFSMENQ